MSRTVVNALSRVVAHRTSRRGLLARSAFGATALAVAPVAFTMRPISAHAAICSCANSSCACSDLCCDGFSDFCCKLTGENLCPPNTVVAGWWKADGTGFCDVGDSPRPRYYLDCNHLCEDGCGCGWTGVCSSSCTDADCHCLEGCDSRSVDCTRFRYGQCNQDIVCVGPIACRIVTCVPPWQWDGSCNDTPATDNSTGSHDRPCLHDGFTDLAPNAYYTEAVAWAFEQEITAGYSSDIFGPHEPVLRWHLAAFLWRYQGQPEPLTSSRFSDVEGLWYARAVNWMAEAEITSGTEDGRFDPDAQVTRGQAITFLWRMAGRPAPRRGAPTPFRETPYPFDDVDVNAYYREAAHWAAQVGITNGLGERTFGGEREIDRAQAVTFLHRYKMLNQPQDVEDAEDAGDAAESENSDESVPQESESEVPA